jgi:hypothetical protein
MMTHKAGRNVLGVLGLVLLASACTASGAQPESAAPVDPSKGVTVTLRNEKLADARVYLRVDGGRRPLGTVTGGAEETFFEPLGQISVVRIEFDLIQGERCVTAELSIGPGEEIEYTIPMNLAMVTAVCRGP